MGRSSCRYSGWTAVCVVVAEDQVEIPVAIHVRQHRVEVVEVVGLELEEGAGGAGTPQERGWRPTAGVGEVEELGVVFADHRVEIAVRVEIHQRHDAPIAHVDAGEGIGAAGALDEEQSFFVAGIGVVAKLARVVPEREVEIAVPIEIRQLRRSPIGIERNGSEVPVTCWKAGTSGPPVLRKRAKRPVGVLVRRSRSPSPSMSPRSTLPSMPTSVLENSRKSSCRQVMAGSRQGRQEAGAGEQQGQAQPSGAAGAGR